MSFSHEYNVPVFIGTGAVLTSGDTSKLAGGQIGVFNGKTYQALTGALSPRQDVLIAAGSWHKKDKINKFWGGRKESDKTIKFLGKDVFEFHRSMPRVAQSEQWVIGWDGINDCDTLSYECGKTYTYKVRVWGEDVYGTFLRPIDRFVSVTTDCCDGNDCTESCADGVSCKKYAQKLADTINNDPELGFFVRAEAISSDFAAKTPTHTIWSLRVPDMGDPIALAAVQTAFPTATIERTDRQGIYSTYEFCLANTAADPTDFTPTGEILQAVCGECPAGFTLVGARDVYVVNRPLAGNEALTTANARQTFANTITTAYSGTLGKFLSQNGNVAAIQFTVAPGATVNALLADTVYKVAEQGAVCNPSSPAAIAWAEAGDRYRTTRTLCMSLENECDGNRLAEVQAFYANNPDVVANSIAIRTTGDCGNTYEIQQYNNECLVDGCLADAVPSYNPLQSFDGFTWEECPCAAPEEVTETLCGVRVEAAYEDTRFGGCSFSPTDYYSVRPLKLEITQFDDSGLPCNDLVPSRKIRNSSMATQSGEYVIRQYIRSNVYKAFGEFYHDPRMREALDAELHEVINRDKFYKLYYLKVKQNRENFNPQGQYSPEIFEFMFAFPEDVNTSAFETMIQNFTSQFGVVLQDR